MERWIESSARRRSAEQNIKTAIEMIVQAKNSGGPRSAGPCTWYKEALCLLRLAVRDLENSESQR